MKQDEYNLPGIVEVSYLDPSQISPGIIGKYLAGVPVSVFADGISMPLHGEVTCQAADEHSNNGRTERVTLTFMTVGDVPREPKAWLLRDANGNRWLIGSRERNWPVAKVTTNTGVPGGDRAIQTVEVTHQAYKALIPLTV